MIETREIIKWLIDWSGDQEDVEIIITDKSLRLLPELTIMSLVKIDLYINAIIIKYTAGPGSKAWRVERFIKVLWD